MEASRAKTLELLSSAFGDAKHVGGGNITTVCPWCHAGRTDNKLKMSVLPINEKIQLWSCWVCGRKGSSLRTLFKASNRPKYAELIPLYNDLILQKDSKYTKIQSNKVLDYTDVQRHDIPNDLIPYCIPAWELEPSHHALKYLTKDRGLSLELIEYYNIHYVPELSHFTDELIESLDFTLDDKTQTRLQDSIFVPSYDLLTSNFDSAMFEYPNPLSSYAPAWMQQILYPDTHNRNNPRKRVLNYFVIRKLNYYEKGTKYFNPKFFKTHSSIPRIDRCINNAYVNWELPLVLVEGIFDALTIHRNVLPLLGTALPESIIESLLLHNTPEVIVCLDQDASAKQGHIAQQCLNLGIKIVRVASLPTGEDPSSLGHEKIWDYLNNASPYDFTKKIQNNMAIL